MIEKYGVTGRKLYIVFVVFEKAFHCVLNRSDLVGTEKKRSGGERNKGNQRYLHECYNIFEIECKRS